MSFLRWCVGGVWFPFGMSVFCCFCLVVFDMLLFGFCCARVGVLLNVSAKSWCPFGFLLVFRSCSVAPAALLFQPLGKPPGRFGKLEMPRMLTLWACTKCRCVTSRAPCSEGPSRFTACLLGSQKRPSLSLSVSLSLSLSQQPKKDYLCNRCWFQGLQAEMFAGCMHHLKKCATGFRLKPQNCMH